MARRFFIVALCATLLSVGVSAQTFGGLTMGQSDFLVTDMVQYGQTSYNYGTARTAAMAGAFTSLGADLSSMSINPAGLGMYRTSEAGVTFGMNFNSSKFATPYGEHQRNRFAMNNLGAAMNLYVSSGALTSFTFGFGYNKLADYNYRLSARTPNSHASIADLFEQQLAGTSSSLLGDNAYWNTDAYLWGSVLAYKNYLIDPAATDGEYITSSIAPDASVEHLSQVDSRGHMGEFNLSGGFNIRNNLYLGFSLGIVDLQHDKRVFYGESYTNNGLRLDVDGNVVGLMDNRPSNVPLIYTDYIQRVVSDGTGINLKIGAIVRPVTGLRLGVAFHTPTIMSIDRTYYGQMYVKGFDIPNDKYVESSENVQYTDELKSKCTFTTPARLMLGASYTFGQMAIVSVDYERAWYNGMRLDASAGRTARELYKQIVKDSFKGTNTLRAGVEVRPLPMVALRAGYSFNGSMMRDTDAIFDNPIESTTSSASAGIGFNFGRCTLDMTYVYQNTKLSTYDLFYYQNASGSFTSQSGELTGQLNRHQAILSFSVKM
jgi:hypothetical protein